MNMTKLIKSTRSGLLRSTLALAALAAGWAGTARGANATWYGTMNTVWATTNNWNSSLVVPGTGNTATFNNAGNGNTTLDLGAGVTINTVLFDTASAAAYTIGSGSVGSQTLTLNASGAITVNSTVTASELFNANLVLGTGSGAITVTIANNSTTGGQLLTIAGGVSGYLANTKTLAVTGAGNTEMSGVISTGSATTFALTKSGTGILTLKGANTYNGVTTVTGGTLKIGPNSGGVMGSLNSASALTFRSGMGLPTFNYDSTGVAATTSLAMGKIDGVNGYTEGVVKLANAADHSSTLTFASLDLAQEGGSVNFVYSGAGVIGTDSKIVITGQAAGLITSSSQKVFVNGADFGWMSAAGNAGGYVRATSYGSDANTATTAGSSSGLPTTATPASSCVEMTGNVSGQNTATIQNLAMRGADRTLTLNSSQTLSFYGIIKSGGGAGTIAGGTGIKQQGNNSAMGIRTDLATDHLTINTAILGNPNSRLYKSGAGTLTLTGTNTWNYGTYIQDGTLEVGGAGVYGIARDATNGKTYINSADALFKFNSSVANTVPDIILGAGALTQTGSGVLTLSGVSTFTGQLTVEGGTLAIATINDISVAGPLGQSTRPVILGKSGGGMGTLQFTGTSATYSSTKPFTMATGGSGTFQIDSSTTTLTLSGAISGAGGLAKSGAGTLEFSTTAKTYTGDTTVSDGTLKLSVASTLDDSSSLKIVTGAGKNPKVELAGGTETVNAFYIDGKQQAKGTWGASGSSYLTGTGVLDVKTGPLRGTMIMIF